MWRKNPNCRRTPPRKLSTRRSRNFQVADRKASIGRNPRTGEAVQIPASRVPKFRAGKALKEAVNA
jgi:nucleoid DNA-binding protein